MYWLLAEMGLKRKFDSYAMTDNSDHDGQNHTDGVVSIYTTDADED